MGTRERREREKEALKQKILAAARELFIGEGYQNVTMRRIADKIDYSLPTIYEHFKNKAEILLHIYHQSGQVLLDNLQEAFQKKTDPIERLEALGRAYIATGLENRKFYELTFLINSIRAEKDITCLESESSGSKTAGSPSFQAFLLLVRTIEEAQKAGFFYGKNPMLLSQTFWAGLHGLVSLMITHPEFPWVDRDTLTDSMVKTLVEGSLSRHTGEK